MQLTTFTELSVCPRSKGENWGNETCCWWQTCWVPEAGCDDGDRRDSQLSTLHRAFSHCRAASSKHEGPTPQCVHRPRHGQCHRSRGVDFRPHHSIFSVWPPVMFRRSFSHGATQLRDCPGGNLWAALNDDAFVCPHRVDRSTWLESRSQMLTMSTCSRSLTERPWFHPRPFQTDHHSDPFSGSGDRFTWTLDLLTFSFHDQRSIDSELLRHLTTDFETLSVISHPKWFPPLWLTFFAIPLTSTAAELLNIVDSPCYLAPPAWKIPLIPDSPSYPYFPFSVRLPTMLIRVHSLRTSPLPLRPFSSLTSFYQTLQISSMF